MNKNQIFDSAVEILSNHLQLNKLRKTPERFAILKEIYFRDEHFDVEDLHQAMVLKEYIVSRATLYNTLELFLECGLVTKLQFGQNLAYYEKSLGTKQHDHMICSNCYSIIEFCDPRIQQIKQQMGQIMEFKVTHHSLHLYGICKKCSEKLAD